VNTEKWTNPRLPTTLVALKLTEEVGEISKAVNEWAMAQPQSRSRNNALFSVLEEIDHTFFILRELQTRMERELDK
jgi:NTP pyrophosphatase (non-canonical NTP hydrolase)